MLFLTKYLANRSISIDSSWLNKQNLFEDFPIIVGNYERIDLYGYFLVNQKIFQNPLQKFTNVKLNALINKRSFYNMILNVFQCRRLLLPYICMSNKSIRHYNFIIAGGVFTNYNRNLFCEHFSHYFDYFCKTKDIDIFYYNANNIEPHYENLYCKLENYNKIFNLVGCKQMHTTDILNTFDFDVCKLRFNFFLIVYYNLRLIL